MNDPSAPRAVAPALEAAPPLAVLDAMRFARRFRDVFMRAPRALSFDELVAQAACDGMRLSDVVAWLHAAQAAGFIERVERGGRYAASGRGGFRPSERGRAAWRTAHRGDAAKAE